MKVERTSYDAMEYFTQNMERLIQRHSEGLHKKLDQLERKWKKRKKEKVRVCRTHFDSLLHTEP